ncbi:efflux RND transporter periplasmic adaptor subunit [Singulisphaera sp. GP187]|uniref:efflux RND transporter periplasmic adaptor subunit n=1 Tax=Singulisphaera sp. GP187 TaxID=1882752 RepID=UPI00094144E0|nr:efflux RND transporter periplasmic adaptor subunit [Singulisphaera sp. GP187]
MMSRIVVATIALGILVAGLAAANLRRDPGAFEVDWRLVSPPAREVIVEPPTRGAIIQTVAAPGKVEAVEEAEIASQLVGRVVAVKVKDGDSVKADDVLVQLDDTDAKARLDSSKARIERLRSAIEQAGSDVDKANRDAKQSGTLAGRGFTAPNELADARTAVAKSQAALAMSRHELIESEAMRRTSQQDLDRTTIKAPIDGVVAGVNVDVGEVVIAGTTNLPGSVLMTISDMNRMRVRADVDETDVPLVRRGQPALVYLQADQLHPVAGTVDMVAPKGKTKDEVVSFETLVSLDGSTAAAHSALRPAMTATVEIEVRRASAALGVPAQAVVHRRRKDLPNTPSVRAWAERNARSPGEKAQEAELRYIKIVFVAEGGIARARPVETGLSDERKVEILSGLKPGEPVVVGPFRTLDELKDGDPVKPVKTLSEAEAAR